TTGEAPALPSAIQVLANSNGLLNVLVSSQGSDTISVFTLAGSTSVGGPSLGGGLASSLSLLQSAAVSAIQVNLLTTSVNIASASATSVSTTASTSTSSSSATTISTSTATLSLGNFSSSGSGSARGVGEALLVSVEGNTYLSVPI